MKKREQRSRAEKKPYLKPSCWVWGLKSHSVLASLSLNGDFEDFDDFGDDDGWGTEWAPL